jgi:hypothetical protein
MATTQHRFHARYSTETRERVLGFEQRVELLRLAHGFASTNVAISIGAMTASQSALAVDTRLQHRNAAPSAGRGGDPSRVPFSDSLQT